MSWWERFRETGAPLCEECGSPTVVEHEELVSTIPTVFELIVWCRRCGRSESRCRAFDCP
jgi:hypothetical protein